ncbi:MAG: glycosyltransferase family 4 protein [Ideonella sp.]|nr:glycosyltransferase family 4 protein [Ideonella sp.]
MTVDPIIFVACPWNPIGGGMYKVADYLFQSQQPEATPHAARARLMPLDTRGGGSALASAGVLLGALWRMVVQRRAGRLVGVHVNMAERLSLFRKCAVVVWARALGVPVVLHLHAAQLHHFYAQLPRPVQTGVRWVFSLATRCLVLGEAGRRFVTQTLAVPPERVEIVVNGVPRQPTQRRADPQGHSPRRRLVFLGNLSERKGVSDLLRALAQSRQAQQGWVDAVFVGGGDVAHYQALAQSLGVQAQVQFVGWADQAQAAQHLAQADALALPSYDEGLPLVILEALGQGVAVIATPVGEIPQALQHGQDAWLVPPGDIAALAAGIDALLSDDALRQRLEQRGLSLYEQRYALSRFADAVAAVHWRCFGHAARPVEGMPHD